MTRAQKRLLVAIVAVGGAVRLAWLLYAKSAPPLTWLQAGDQYSYYHFGSEMAAGRGYKSYITHEPTAYWPVGYPAILAVLFWVALHTPVTNDLMLVAGLFHVAVSTATIALVFVVARALFGIRAGFVAAAVMAVWPNLVYQVATIQLETTFIFLSVAALAIVVTHDWEAGLPSTRRLLAFGAVLGVSVLVRPFSAWFVVGLAVAALAVKAGWRRALATAAIPTAVVLLISIPWVVRNAVQMDAFVPSSTNMGDGLCMDRFLGANGTYRLADHDGCVDPKLDEVARNKGNTRKAIRFVVTYPKKEAWLIMRRTVLMYSEDHDGIQAAQGLDPRGPQLSPGTERTLSRTADWYFFGVLGVAVTGLPLLVAGRRRTPQKRIVLVALAALAAIPALLWGNPRFHLPVAPFIAVLAGGSVAWLLDRLRPASPTREDPVDPDGGEDASQPLGRGPVPGVGHEEKGHREHDRDRSDELDERVAATPEL